MHRGGKLGSSLPLSPPHQNVRKDQPERAGLCSKTRMEQAEPQSGPSRPHIIPKEVSYSEWLLKLIFHLPVFINQFLKTLLVIAQGKQALRELGMGQIWGISNTPDGSPFPNSQSDSPQTAPQAQRPVEANASAGCASHTCTQRERGSQRRASSKTGDGHRMATALPLGLSPPA